MFHNSSTTFYTELMVKVATRTPSTRIGPEVLRAAVAILDDEGPDGFTVRAIARKAKVAPMAIYNHFDGVNGVLEALWIEGFEKLRNAITVQGSNPEEDLLKTALAYRAFAMANRGLYTVMFMHRFRNFEPSLAAAQLAASTYVTLVVSVERCQEVGFFSHSRASDAAQVIWSGCHGYVSLELLGNNFATDHAASFDLLLSMLRDGFR
jgi:AcrR family transcriptional regulator